MLALVARVKVTGNWLQSCGP